MVIDMYEILRYNPVLCVILSGEIIIVPHSITQSLSDTFFVPFSCLNVKIYKFNLKFILFNYEILTGYSLRLQ